MLDPNRHENSERRLVTADGHTRLTGGQQPGKVLPTPKSTSQQPKQPKNDQKSVPLKCTEVFVYVCMCD